MARDLQALRSAHAAAQEACTAAQRAVAQAVRAAEEAKAAGDDVPFEVVQQLQAAAEHAKNAVRACQGAAGPLGGGL
jgi:hypothetical protein